MAPNLVPVIRQSLPPKRRWLKLTMPLNIETKMLKVSIGQSHSGSRPYLLIELVVLIDNYLNGPRTLSDKRLSYLIVSSTDSAQQQGCKSGDDVARYDILICATHFLGDGMALHQSAQELLTLLATETDESLLKLLQVEAQAIREKAYNPENASLILPLSLEERLPQSPRGALFSAASLVDHLASQRRQIVRKRILTSIVSVELSNSRARGDTVSPRKRRPRVEPLYEHFHMTQRRQRQSLGAAKRTVSQSRAQSSHSAISPGHRRRQRNGNIQCAFNPWCTVDVA